MTAPVHPQGVLSMGDALAVLATLGAADAAKARQTLGLLGYRLTTPPDPHEAYQPPEGAPESPPEPDGTGTLPRLLPSRAAPLPAPQGLDQEPQAVDLPPTQRAVYEDLWEAPPELPSRDPLAQVTQESGPQPKRSLLTRRYERALLRELCLIEQLTGEVDVEALVRALSNRRPLHRVPRLRRRRTAPQVWLWLDESEPMQVFGEDLQQLQGRLERLLAGTSQVRVQRGQGLPEPEGTQGEGPGPLMLWVSSLGVGGHPRLRLGWREGFARIDRWRVRPAGTAVSVLAPMSARRWEGTVPGTVKGMEWSRVSRPGRRVATGTRARMRTRRQEAALEEAPGLQRLLRACALSVRITPGLLRQLRLTLLPHLGPESESELWSAPLIREADASGAALLQKASEALRQELPGYHPLITFLHDVGQLSSADEAVLRPTVAIDDGFDDLWLGRILPARPRVAPGRWGDALRVLRRILNEGRWDQAVAAFPAWEQELRAFQRGEGILFAEQIRQISLEHARRNAAQHFEEALIWHAFNAARGDAASDARAEALVAALHAELISAGSLAGGLRAREWVRQRHGELPDGVRQRHSYQRVARLAGAVETGESDPVTACEPQDVYVLREGAQLMLSPQPMEKAFRIRADGRKGLPITVRQAGTSSVVQVERLRRVRVEGEIELLTGIGDVFRLPAGEAPSPGSDARVWLQHVAEERRRRDWVGLMRWAAQAADHPQASATQQVEATLAFARAARLADLRVVPALARVMALLPRLELLGMSPEACHTARLSLVLAQVELLMLDSHLEAAIHEAQRGLEMAGDRPEMAGLAARLRCRRVEALLSRGRWQEALQMVEGLPAPPADGIVAAWHALALCTYAAHRLTRKDARRAWRALESVADQADKELALELTYARADLIATLRSFEQAREHYERALELARQRADQPAIRRITLRLARDTLNNGEEAQAEAILKPLVAALPGIRSRRDATTVHRAWSYHLEQVQRPGAEEAAAKALQLLPEEELSRRASSYDQASRARSHNADTHAWTEAVRLYAQTGQLARFLNEASHYAFEDAAGWLRELLEQQVGGATAPVALRRAVRTLGVSCLTINILGRMSEHEADDRRAERAIRHAFRIARILGAYIYLASAVRNFAWGMAGRLTGEKETVQRRAAMVLRWLDTTVAILERKGQALTYGVSLMLWQVYYHYQMGADAPARRCCERALHVSKQLGNELSCVTALIQLAFLARRRGAHLEAASLLRQARLRWAENEKVRRALDSQDWLATANPLHAHGVATMFYDAAESFKGKGAGVFTLPELAFADDLLWLANDCFIVALHDDRSSAINDLWYVVSQLKNLPLPTAAVTWAALVRAQTALDPAAARLAAFRREQEKITQLLRGGTGATAPREEPRPVRALSQTARFLQFRRLQTVSPWLRERVRSMTGTDTDNARLGVAALAFWPQARLLVIGIAGPGGALEQFAVLWGEQEILWLNWSREPLHALARAHPPVLETDAQAILYCQFFLHFVRGPLGRWIIVQSADELPWLDPAASERREEALEAARSQARALVQPARVLRRQGALITLEATVLHCDALLRTGIHLAAAPCEVPAEGGLLHLPAGGVQLFEETLLLEQLPVHVEPHPVFPAV